MCQVIGGEDVEGLQYVQLFWYVGWEEQFVDYCCEEYVDDEVVEFQCVVQGGQVQGVVVGGSEWLVLGFVQSFGKFSRFSGSGYDGLLMVKW